MGKKLLIGLVAIVGFLAVWHTTADAQQCLAYRSGGGSSICLLWGTKGVLLDVTFKQVCPDVIEDLSAASTTSCTPYARAVATADSDPVTNGTENVVALCTKPTGGVTPVKCSLAVHFTGSSDSVTCVAKQDNESPTGDAHENEQRGCEAKFALVPFGPNAFGCNSCCASLNTGTFTSVCQDVTPVEMQTTVEVFSPAFSEGGGGTCAPEDTSCLITQTCSINPKKIGLVNPITFAGSRNYQCNLDCAGTSCSGEGG
jgi:hypothetical protein